MKNRKLKVRWEKEEPNTESETKGANDVVWIYEN